MLSAAGDLSEERRQDTPMSSASAACPYCGKAQSPPPQRRRKCRDCGRLIYVRTDRRTGKRRLLTESQVEDIERRERAARWRELTQKAQSAERSGDLQAMRQAYLDQAYFLNHEGKPHHDVARKAARCDLLRMQRIGIQTVVVMTGQDERVCDYCQRLEGKEFDVAEALRTMPLPGPNCDRNHGLCRCVYVAGRIRPQRTASTPPTRRSGCGLVTLIGTVCVLLAVALVASTGAV